MNENKELANSYLFDLFEKRFCFLEDDDISQNMRKASELDMILEEYNIDSIDDLRSKLDSQKRAPILWKNMIQIMKRYILQKRLWLVWVYLLRRN